MELYKGNRYWPTTWQTNSMSLSRTNSTCDVAIIGGGISGMLSAYVLARSGLKVTLFEQGRIGNGSTSLNTGLIQYMSDDLLIDLAERFDLKTARHFYRASFEALDLLEEIAVELPQNPQLRRNNSIYLAADASELRRLGEEALAHQAIGLPTRLIDERELADRHHLRATGALMTRRDLELNPYQFTRFMAETAMERYGLVIHEDIQVRESDIDLNRKILVHGEITCQFDRLLLATGYAPLPFVRSHLPQMKLISTFACITQPLAKSRLIPSDCMVWESARPYLYFRSAMDGRLIVGGADEENTRLSAGKAARIGQELLHQVQQRLIEPSGLIPEFTYEAIFSESGDGLPYLGPHPHHPEVFLLHGIGGNGTVYSAIGAKLALQFAQGRLDPAFRYLFPGQTRTLT